jgi:hypothetical protein
MGNLVLNGATSGATTLTPTDAVTTTVTFPSLGGTAMVSGNMPAFSYYLSSSQNITASTWTKITFNTKTFDTNNNFDSTTNYRFTPTVAGYYQINVIYASNSTATNPIYSAIAIYKNGAGALNYAYQGTSSAFACPGISTIIYFNGSTDYVEFYAYMSGGTGTLQAYGGSQYTYVSGSLIRTA